MLASFHRVPKVAGPTTYCGKKGFMDFAGFDGFQDSCSARRLFTAKGNEASLGLTSVE